MYLWITTQYKKRIIIIYNWWQLSIATYLKKTSKNHCFGQKRSVLKRTVSLMYTNLRISWLELLEVADWEPYNKKLTFSLTFKFKKRESTFSRFLKSSNLRRIKMPTQEEVFSSLNFTSVCSHSVYCTSKTMSKFMFIQMTKLKSKMSKEFNTKWIID